MNIANIYINGQIGNTYNEDGTVRIKGVELADVVSQMNASRGADVINVYINSPGGSIEIGRAISKYIGSFANVFTIADTMCASMGTEIHLSVPLERRKIIAGTQYIIHNPMLVGVTGNASELSEASEYIKTFEKEMLNMYASATNLEKTALEGLMSLETSLTCEQCKEFNFVSEIIPRSELKAVAFIEKQTNTNQIINEMKKTIKELVAVGLNNLRKELGIKVAEVKTEAKAEVLTNEAGESIYLSKPIADFIADNTVEILAFSDEAMTTPIEEMEIEVGENKIKIEGGKVVAVEPINEMSPEMEIAQLKAEIETLKSEKETMLNDFEAQMNDELTKLKSEIGSAYQPKGEIKKFVATKKTSVAKVEEKSPKELAKERREKYKTK